MAKNVGKAFENDFAKSVPDYCWLHRLKDTAQAYNQSEKTKYTRNNPYDYLVFNTKTRTLWCFELKSTKQKYMTFENVSQDSPEPKLIHKHQIEGLTKASIYDGINAGFILNFRDEKNNVERTYFQRIEDFNRMCKSINKKSFNEMDLILHHAITIAGEKKRVKYTWNLDKFFSEYH